MGWLSGPQTGARDGKKDYKEQTDIKPGRTGSNWIDEEKRKRGKKKVDKHAEKLANKNGWGLW